MLHRLAVVLVVLCVGIPTQAEAGVVSGPFVTTTPIPSTLTDWRSSLSFPKFDSSLGTLTSVELDLSGHFATVITVTNIGTGPSTGTAKTEVAVTVQDGGGNLSVPELDLFSSNYVFTDLPAGQSVDSGTINKSGGSSDVYTQSAVLAAFTGPGTIVLSASTYTQSWIAYSGGNSLATQVTSADLTGSVRYTYVPVPEPSAILLLGIGALGLLCGTRLGRKS